MADTLLTRLTNCLLCWCLLRKVLLCLFLFPIFSLVMLARAKMIQEQHEGVQMHVSFEIAALFSLLCRRVKKSGNF